jgi:hypothetical protein
VATAALLLLHAIVLSAASAGLTSAARVCLSPTASVSVAGETVTPLTSTFAGAGASFLQEIIAAEIAAVISRLVIVVLKFVIFFLI